MAEMHDAIESLLASTLLRTLQIQPTLAPDDALTRVANIVSSGPFLASDIPGVRQFLQDVIAGAHCHGVINPTWISQTQGADLYFYLVKTQPGWLQVLERQARSSERISYYVLYGEWDVLLCLHGVSAESNILLEQITATTPYECLSFSASQILYFHRHKVGAFTEIEAIEGRPSTSPKIALDTIDAFVDDYNNPAIRPQRDQLQKAGIILGPTWEFKSSLSVHVDAHVGITLRGPVHNVSPQLLLENLLLDEALRTCLVHLVELHQARPFNYMAKLSCRDLDELDRATDAIESRRIGTVTMSGTTFVVSRGNNKLLRASGQKAPTIVTPDTRGIENLVQETVGRLGPEAIASFNLLDAHLQPLVLDTLYELRQQVDSGCWDEEMGEYVSPALELFSRAVLGGARPGTLHGPVINIARAVEKAFKEALERIVRRVYGHDVGRAQKELQLRSRKFKEFTLGSIASALRAIKMHKDFEFISNVLDDELLDNLERFADARNQWAHARERRSKSPHAEIDDARHAFSNGIELIQWLAVEVVPAIEGTHRVSGGEGEERVLLPADNSARQFGIFLSHSAANSDVAERIAVGLRALKYPVWYADWAIKAGESIVEKINDALAKNDTLIVLLSNESILSRWVRREFTVALMDQLAGQDVTVIPILVEQCTIPSVLRAIRYIDMRPEQFEAGFIKLVQFLGDRMRQRSPQGA